MPKYHFTFEERSRGGMYSRPRWTTVCQGCSRKISTAGHNTKWCGRCAKKQHRAYCKKWYAKLSSERKAELNFKKKLGEVYGKEANRKESQSIRRDLRHRIREEAQGQE